MQGVKLLQLIPLCFLTNRLDGFTGELCLNYQGMGNIHVNKMFLLNRKKQ
jgi:hypothetical protein